VLINAVYVNMDFNFPSTRRYLYRTTQDLYKLLRFSLYYVG
jgi:hypothetical protein